jgi:hypothetical protein
VMSTWRPKAPPRPKLAIFMFLSFVSAVSTLSRRPVSQCPASGHRGAGTLSSNAAASISFST